MTYQIGDLVLLSASNPQYWLALLQFIIAVFLAIYVPGSFFFRSLNLPFIERTALSLGTGTALWSLQGFLLGFLKLRELTYLYLLIFLLLFIFHKRSSANHKAGSKPIDIWSVGILFGGVVFQLIPVWCDALLTPNGLSFCSDFPINSLGHISVTNQVIKRIPPYQPGVFGLEIHNWHYFTNIAAAELVRIFHLPLIPTQSQFILLFISALFGGSIFAFASAVDANAVFRRCLLFFMYFGTSFLTVSAALFGGQSNPSRLYETNYMLLTNPPTAISVSLFFTAIALVLMMIKNKHSPLFFAAVIVTGTLIGFKVYAGIIILLGLFILALFRFFRDRDKVTILLFMISLIIALIIYLPVNKGAGGLYLSFFATVEEFAGSYKKLSDLPIYDFAIYMTKHKRLLHGSMTDAVKILFFESVLTVLFILSYFGTKVIGLIQTKVSRRLLPTEVHTMLLPGITASLILGMFFRQTSGGGHTLNFIDLSLFLFTVYMASALAAFWMSAKSHLLRFIFLAFISIHILRYLQQGNLSLGAYQRHRSVPITREELEAARYIRSNLPNDASILVDGKNHLDFLSAYVSLLTDRPMVLSGEKGLGDHNIDVHGRARLKELIFSSPYRDEVDRALSNLGADYLYLLPETHLTADETKIGKVVFQNPAVRLIEVDKIP